MPRMIASCFTCYFVLSFFFCLCPLICIFNLPQQHTIHVVVSCIFTIQVSFCRSAAFSSVLVFCNLQQSELTDHMNVSSDEWGWGPQLESLCWSEEEKNLLSAVNPPLLQLCATWLKCSNVKKWFSFYTEGLSVLKSSFGNISKPVFWNWWSSTTKGMGGSLLSLCNRFKIYDFMAQLVVDFSSTTVFFLPPEQTDSC